MEMVLQSCTLCFLFITFILFIFTNDAQDEMYMDEVFHIPQAQQYCKGNFSAWDPMITTLPGLYLLSLLALLPVSVTSGQDLSSVCLTSALRGVNIVFALGNFYLLFLIIRKLHSNTKDKARWVLTALALGSFPVLYFFSFLYYTDPAAIFFALLTYSYGLQNKHILASASGVLAILCRQTNIIWVAFVAIQACGKTLIKWSTKKQGETQNISEWKNLYHLLTLVVNTLFNNPKDIWVLVIDVIKAAWCYILVGLSFVVFVIVNGGIVVGDRNNHRPCLNFPQVFYFLFFSTFFSWMHMVSVKKVKYFLNQCLQKPLKLCLFVTMACVMIYGFTFIHEYNLADNRHYNFYFLSKLVLRNKYFRYLLIPAYYYSFLTMSSLLQHKDVFWKLAFFACAFITLVPQKLIEFRYFILPYLLFRLNMRMPSRVVLLIEVIFYYFVNAFTVYMYTMKPFRWHDSDKQQRFIW